MSSGSIQFVADTSQFSGEMEKASKSTLAVAASAESARKRIVESYQQQIKAAQDVGASQAQLESISRRSATQLASVTEDSARRYINAIDRMEDRTRRFNAARATLGSSTISSPVSSFNLGGYAAEATAAKGLSEAVEGVSESHRNGTSAAVQFGSVLRGVEGNFSRNIRAAEAFGSSLKFLAPLIDVAFPIVGAAALGYAIFEMGKKAYDAFENIVLLRDAIKGLNELQIKVDSDHEKSLDKQEQNLENNIDHQGIGGHTASLQQKYKYQSQKPLDLSSYFYSSEYKKLPDDVKGGFESDYKSVAPDDAPAKIQKITGVIKELNGAIASVKNHTSGAYITSYAGGPAPGTTRDPLSYYQAQLTAASQIKSKLTDTNSDRTSDLGAISSDVGASQTDDQKKAAAVAQAAATKAAEAMRRQAEAQHSAMESQLATMKNDHQVSTAEELSFWTDMLAPAKKYSENYKTVIDRMGQLNQELGRELEQSAAKADEANKKKLEDQKKNDDEVNRLLDAQDKAQHRGADFAGQLLSIGQQSKGNLQTQSINRDVTTGSLSKHDAAMQVAAIHAADYAAKLQALQDDQKADDNDSSLTADQRIANKQGRQVQGAKIQGEADVTAAQDAWNTFTSSGLGGATLALQEFSAASKDSAAQAKNLINSAISGINDVLITQLTTRHTGMQTRQALGNYGAGLARSVASAGLNKTEGAVLGAFGLGGKLGGSASTPLWVKSVESAAGGALNSAGGLFGDVKTFFSGNSKGPGQSGLSTALAISRSADDGGGDGSGTSPAAGGMGLIGSLATGLLSGGLAVGGTADANANYLVGERGPEILSMGGSAGRVIPNSGIGGSSGHTINVDARSSTDPAQTRVQVMRGIRQAAPQIAAQTIQSQKQTSMRTPPSRRK